MKRHDRNCMHVKSAETFILHTLADSVNFSCSGLLCSSYSTTPSGPLAGAGLPSPGAPLRLPLAASSWVSRRLQATRKRSQTDQRISVFNTVISPIRLRLILCWLSCWTCSLFNIGCSPTISFHILIISLLLLLYIREIFSISCSTSPVGSSIFAIAAESCKQ